MGQSSEMQIAQREKEELQSVQVLRLFETTKAERENFIVQVVEAIDSGDCDPLKIHIQIKAMEDIITGLTSLDEKKNSKRIEFAKRYRNALFESAQKNGNKFQLHNAEFRIGETGVKYDYSQCGDEILLGLYKQRELLLSEIKEREKFLQNLTKATTIVNEDTGEATTFYPPAKSSTTSVSVTLK